MYKEQKHHKLNSKVKSVKKAILPFDLISETFKSKSEQTINLLILKWAATPDKKIAKLQETQPGKAAQIPPCSRRPRITY